MPRLLVVNFSVPSFDWLEFYLEESKSNNGTDLHVEIFRIFAINLKMIFDQFWQRNGRSKTPHIFVLE